jgi:hypothetical protein
MRDFIITETIIFFIGYEAGYNNVGDPADSRTSKWNTFIGYQAGRENTIGWHNMAIGYNAGLSNQEGTNQMFIGNEAGQLLTEGYGNSFIGHGAGRSSMSCSNNTFVGYYAGAAHDNGDNNVLMGYGAGGKAIVASNNVMIGTNAGYNMEEGSGNIFIGSGAGYNETGSDKLYISNSSAVNPLIYGDFTDKSVNITGSLLVNGEIISPSDVRLKENILKFTSGLSVVSAISGYYFDWNDVATDKLGLEKKKQIGVLAQELEKVLPEAVLTDKKSGYKSVDYMKLTPVLIEAVKEQQAQIEVLKSENIDLKEQVSKMKDMQKEIESLKKITEELSKLILKEERSPNN